MQVSQRIDQLISSLDSLKPNLSTNLEKNQKEFENILESALMITQDGEDTHLSSESLISSQNKKEINNIPWWVDANYSYDPANPRKPNMRELMSAISGIDSEILLATDNKELRELSSKSSHILYGVVGSNTDTRNWSKIMDAENVLSEARIETGRMYNPKIKIQDEFGQAGQLIDQFPVLTDSDGNILTALTVSPQSVEETILNFGAVSSSIPINLSESIKLEKFRYHDIVQRLKTFTGIEQIQA